MEILRMLWVPAIHIVITFVVVHSLKQTEMTVPLFADRGETVNLTCKFNLEGGVLYSVKWYKDGNEFFRYAPDNDPIKQVFQRPGVVVDETLSGMNIVALKNLTYSSSGTYRCEISTEGPQFSIVFRNLNMTVLSYPKHNPVVVGVKPAYGQRDNVSVNCTAAPSNPAPDVDWFINGEKADSWTIVKPDPIYLSHDETFTKTVALHFKAEEHHYKGPNSELELRCQSTVPGLKSRESTVTLRLASTLTNQKLAQELFNRADLTHNTSLALLVFTTIYFLL